MKYKIILPLLLMALFSNCKKAENNLSVNEDTNALSVLDKKNEKVKFVKNDTATPDSETLETEQKIIKEGNIRFETNDLEATYTQIQKAVKNQNATIQNDTEGKDYNSIFRKLIIRIPNQKFDVFLTEVSKGITYFDNKEITSQDVTAEFIDMSARLKAKKVLENRYLDLLKKANKVSEILEIEAQLSTIREEIESKQGQLNYLQNRVSFSTLTIEFYKPVAGESGVTSSYGMKIWTAIKSGFNSISSVFIVLISIWPFLIILTVLVYFIKNRRNTKNKK